ncbi:MAG TPA: hypothetical protein VFI74_04055 [Candidatus Saccharimonadales bacterium]|nr:hypothetical protein [Candidatus Saccharimonadales bacterium]
MQKILASLQKHIRAEWPTFVAFAMVFVLISILLVYKLDTLLPGYGTAEQSTYAASSSLTSIWNSPVNAPLALLIFGLRHIVGDQLLAARLASVLVGWLTIILFCAVSYIWFGKRTALIGTVVFGTSSWFLHVSRLGTPEVLLFGLFALVACGIWLRERQSGVAIIGGLSLCALALYVPGMAWLLVLGGIWQLRAIDRSLRSKPGPVIIGSFLFLLLLAPLGWHFYQHPGLIRDWLYLPQDWQHPWNFIIDALHVPLSFFVRQPQENPELWLGRMPVFSIFATTMFVFGTFLFLKHARLARTRIITSLAILGSIVIAITGNRVGITILVPFAYLVVAAGIGYIIDQWYQTFPRNPIARGIGTVAIVVTIAAACLYPLRSYFTAWPQAEKTRAVFTIPGKQQ